MGWAYCGIDDKGRDIGYSIDAVCDSPACSNKINRGLSYVCGGMHGGGEFGCGGYFCERHLKVFNKTSLCEKCYRKVEHLDNE